MTDVDQIQKLKKQAVSYEGIGKYDKALQTYERLRQLQPDEPRWLHEIGELNQRLGKKTEAIDAYVRAAKRYAETGLTVKAIALSKVILKLDGDQEKLKRMLTGLFEKVQPELSEERLANAKLESSDFLEEPLDGEVGPQATLVDLTPKSDPAKPQPALSLDEQIGELDLAFEYTFSPPPKKERVPPKPEAHSAHSPPVSYSITLDKGQALDTINLREIFSQEPSKPTEPSPFDSAFEMYFDDQRDISEIDTGIGRISHTPLFASLGREALQQLIEEADVRSFAPGQVIIRQGEPADALFVVIEGALGVFVKRGDDERVRVETITDGQFFGEIGLLTERKRNATIEADKQSSVMIISREVISNLITKYPGTLIVMLHFFRERLITSMIQSFSLAAEFSTRERLQLASYFRLVELESGNTVVKQGTPSDGLCVVLTGTLEAMAEGSRELKRFVLLETGDFFGAYSALTGAPSLSTIQTRSKCWLLKLDRNAILELLKEYPKLLVWMGELARHRRNTVGIPEHSFHII